MKYLLTPASQRAVEFASGWTLSAGCSELSELTAPALLLGLLSEPECRASMILKRLGIDARSVQRRWPSLAHKPPPAPPRFSDEVQLSLRLAQQRLINLPQPLELATEHILLGLAINGGESALWLRQQGIDPASLEAEIRSLYGRSSHLFGPHGPAGVAEEQAVAAGSGSAAEAAEPSTEDLVANDVCSCHPEQPLGTVGSTEVAVLRALDAAANRAHEGLRVAEDYTRFVLDDRHLTGLCKQLRHDLTAALAGLSGRRRLAARETQQDVGTGLTAATERRRADAAGVLTANFARFQQALRSLEEFGKLVDAEMAAACKQLRYQAYTLQRAVETTGQSLERLADARLYVLIDGCSSVDEFQRLVVSLVEAGVDVIQLRDKRLGDRELLARARLLRGWTAENKTLMVVNDRPDIAALARADGVHVGQEELSVKDARTVVGPDALVGVSTHSIEQARQAVLDGADYIGVGPTFPSGTKTFESFPGVDLIRAVAAEVRLPSFAIGGIDRGNLDQVLAAGAARIAVSRAITAASDPAAAARELLLALPPIGNP